MSLYSRDDERKIRVQRLVEDWTKSGLLLAEQRDRMLPDLQVDLRRTNKFLRVTLLVFGFLIVNSLAGLVAVFMEGIGEAVLRWLALIAAAASLIAAQTVIKRYKLYHFGVEEAFAIAAGGFCTIFVVEMVPSRFATWSGFSTAMVCAVVLFRRFGYVYAGIAATLLAPLVVFAFDLEQSDTVRRLIACALLLTIFFVARERREDHDWNYPADAFAAIESVSWVALYLLANLKVSSWFSVPDEVPLFYWGTYTAIWMLPVAGLWIAIRDRHRLLLDLNIVMAIVTFMSNKPYLGLEPKPWDPILFGVMLITMAVGLRRWLASGVDGSRHGFIAERLLASEKERLAMAGAVSLAVPGAPASHPHESPEIGGGGRSGGAGASGKY
jgi:hypothetical protein